MLQDLEKHAAGCEKFLSKNALIFKIDHRKSPKIYNFSKNLRLRHVASLKFNNNGQLQPIKQAINGAKFQFQGDVRGRFDRDVADNSILLAHLEEELLQICNACRSYMFDISWPRKTDTNDSTVKNTITTILQFGPIDGCSKVLFYLRSHFFPTELPVMSIVNWLNRSQNFDTVNAYWQVKKERILEIKSYSIPNLLALVNGLKKVNLNYLCHKK